MTGRRASIAILVVALSGCGFRIVAAPTVSENGAWGGVVRLVVDGNIRFNDRNSMMLAPSVEVGGTHRAGAYLDVGLGLGYVHDFNWGSIGQGARVLAGFDFPWGLSVALGGHFNVLARIHTRGGPYEPGKYGQRSLFLGPELIADYVWAEQNHGQFGLGLAFGLHNELPLAK